MCEPATLPPARKPPQSERVHRVFMRYERKGELWHVDFVQPDMRTPIGRQRRIADSAKVQDLAERSSLDKDLAAMETIAYAIAHGRGGLWCLLTEEQYRRLMR